MSNLVAINPQLSVEANMHAIINAVAVEPLQPTEYTLSNPTVVPNPADPFYNTSIVITSATDKYQGSDTLYYHRPDIANKGLVGTENISHIARPIRLETIENALTQVCDVLNLKASEFNIQAISGRTGYTHRLTAKPESKLYIGSLGVKLVVQATGNILDVVPGFYAPEDANGL